MATEPCTVSGNVADLTGTAIPAAVIVFTRDYVAGQDGSAIVPFNKSVTADGSGGFQVDLMPGAYMAATSIDRGAISFRVFVPDEASGVFANMIDGPDTDITPELLAEALAAQSAAESAQSAAESAQSAAEDAQSATEDARDITETLLEGAQVTYGEVRAFESFGAQGDAVLNPDGTLASGTDDSVSIQAAIDWMVATPGRKLIGRPDAIYRLGTRLEIYGFGAIDMNGSRFFVDFDGLGILAANIPAGPFPLSASYVPGATTLSVAVPSQYSIREGVRIKITSNAVDPANRDRGSLAEQYRVGEQVLLGEGSTQAQLVLASPLRYTEGISPTSVAGDEGRVSAYDLAYTPRVYVFDDSGTLNLQNIKILARFGEQATWQTDLVSLRGYRDGTVGMQSERSYGHGLNLTGCYGGRYDVTPTGCFNGGGGSGQYGYGVVLAQTQGARVSLTGGRNRHSFTTSNTAAGVNEADIAKVLGSGRSYGNIVANSYAVGDTASGFDTHSDSDGCVFVHCQVDSAASFGIGIRGRGIRHVGPVVRNTVGGGCTGTVEYHSGDPDDDFWLAGDQPGDLTSGSIVDASFDVAGKCYSLDLGTYDIGGTGRYMSTDHSAIYVKASTVEISGSQIFTITGGGGTNGTAIIEMVADTSKYSVGSELVITGEVRIDASAATASGIIGLLIPTGCILRVRGLLRIDMPAGATFLSGGGTIITEGSGRIEYSIAGGAGIQTGMTHDALIVDTGNSETYDGRSLTEVSGYDVVDSGTNANGRWKKYRDGTMECWVDGLSVNITTSDTGHYKGSVGWTFPQAFHDTAQLVVSPFLMAGDKHWGSAATNISASNATLRAVGLTSASSYEMGGYARGRWKV